MGIIHIMERSGDDVKRFDESIKRAKSGLMEACEIWEDMKSQFSERGGYSQRESYGERYTPSESGFDFRRESPSMSERDWRELQERRRRDQMGRYM